MYAKGQLVRIIGNRPAIGIVRGQWCMIRAVKNVSGQWYISAFGMPDNEFAHHSNFEPYDLDTIIDGLLNDILLFHNQNQ